MNNNGGDEYTESTCGNFVRGGNGNIYSPELRARVDSYQAALDFEELQLRRQLNFHDIELRRRLMQEQHHQLLSELEYRQQLQQIRHPQAQQSNLNQLLAQSNLLDLQQFNSGCENSLLPFQDEYLLQTRELMMQDQMQQRLLVAELAHASQNQDQFDATSDRVLAMLTAAANYRPYFDESTLQNGDILNQGPPIQRFLSSVGASSVIQGNPPTSHFSGRAVPVSTDFNEVSKSRAQNKKRSLSESDQNSHALKKSIITSNTKKTNKGKPILKQSKTDETMKDSTKASIDETLQDAHVDIDTKNIDDALLQSEICKSEQNHPISKTESNQNSNGLEKPVIMSNTKTEKKGKLISMLSKPDNTIQKSPKTSPREKPEVLNADNDMSDEDDLRLQSEVFKGKRKHCIAKNDVVLDEKKKRRHNDDLRKEEKKKRMKQSTSCKVELNIEEVKMKGKGKKNAQKLSNTSLKGVLPKLEIKKGGKMDGRTKEARALKRTALAGQRQFQVLDQGNNLVNLLNSLNPDRSNDLIQVNSEKCHLETSLDGDNAEAAKIILQFKAIDILDSEMEKMIAWSKEGSATFPDISPTEYPYLTPKLKFNLPKLPIEPQLIDIEYDDKKAMTRVINGEISIEMSNAVSQVSMPPFLDDSQIKFIRPNKVSAPKKTSNDKWWPKNYVIRHAILEHKSEAEDAEEKVVDKSSLTAAKMRLATSIEPGALEKLPHCKLFEDYCRTRSVQNMKSDDPKFCFQVTEMFPCDIMVCCSECSTWRHAQCGGHYKHYSPFSVDPTNVLFKPICDRCFLEQNFVDVSPIAAKRLDRQRIQHLRRCNATNAVVRRAAFSKHGGQYKWPFGNSTGIHIAGNTRSVQSRHEKAEKQWGDMVMRLASGKEMRSKKRVRLRARDLEQLLVHVEDAEGVRDRHNMMLFLQNDTSKRHPVGFENLRRNIFDPEEDPITCSMAQEYSESSTTIQNNSEKSDKMIDNLGIDISKSPDFNIEDDTTTTMECDKDSERVHDNSTFSYKNTLVYLHERQRNNAHICARQGCHQKSRFDSIFCSDSCGISTLEMDLLHSLQYASNFHPSALRA